MTQAVQLATATQDAAAVRRFERNAAIRTSDIYVVFTTVDETLAALRVADALAKAMAAPLTIVHFRTVSYPLSMDAASGLSTLESEAIIARIRAEGFDARVRTYLCRKARHAMPLAFKERSLILIAGRRRWWPTWSKRRRRDLEAAGHFVLVVETAERRENAHA